MTKETTIYLYNNRVKINTWLFENGLSNNKDLFYSSIDIRHSNHKIVPVDMNIFPGGFNNLSQDFLSLASSATVEYFQNIGISKGSTILIFPENHTRNQFYIENIVALCNIIEHSGYKAIIGSLDINDHFHKTYTNYQEIIRQNDIIITKQGIKPDVILLNNDLSSGIPEILNNLEQLIIPCIKAGWYQRLKTIFFTEYNKVINKFCSEFAIDNFIFHTEFKAMDFVDFNSYDSMEKLQSNIDQMFETINILYKERNIADQPFIIVKADNGTYGMGVMSINHDFDFKNITRKEKNKMSVIKEGHKVNKIIIQEGIESIITTSNGDISEPVIYSIGYNTIGGFYRANLNKGKQDNLNSSGMYFNEMQLQDTTSPIFYIYSLIAKLSIIAATRELKLY
jgi:glutamate--cysteine ligase